MPSRGSHAQAIPPPLLQALVDSAPDALYVVDHAGLIRFANPAALALLGYAAAGELLGRSSHATIHHTRPDGTPYPPQECPLLRTPETGETVRVEEDWFVRGDGRLVPVAYASAPLALADGRGAIVTFRDIAEQLLAREALAERAAEQARLAELAASRTRIASAADLERRRLARDLHDGAQQELVRAAISLQLTRRRLERDPDGAREALEEALGAVRAAIRDIRGLAQGMLPPVLAARGLPGAIEELTVRMPFPVTLELDVGRLAAPLEAAAYFIVSEALVNAMKHADARSAAVTATVGDGRLELEVRDDGAGGAAPGAGSGLRGLADRVDALGGTLEVESPQGAGTRVRARIPLSGADT